MRTPLHGLIPPLNSNIVYFHDWRYVHTGDIGWCGLNGESVPMMGPDKVPAMRYEYYNMPLGIRLEAMPARKTDPVLTAAATGEVMLFGGSVIHEDGGYRLWYLSWPRLDFEKGDEFAGNFCYLRYAESTDGIRWKLPKTSRLDVKGDRHHNIVYGGHQFTPATGFHGGCVFKDPSALQGERYKSFYLGMLDAKGFAAYRRKRPADVDSDYLRLAKRMNYGWAIFGAVSKDGITWKPIRGPLLVQYSDTANTCEYDPLLKKYVAYVRTRYMGRRTIGRSVSDDFRNFSFPEEIFWPDAGQLPSDSWYANSKTIMPGTTDYHVMFPMRWSLTTDHFEFHLAASPDNVCWGWVPGGAVCKPGAPGEWDAGVVTPGHGLVELPGNRIGMLYAGTPVPHKYPRRPPLGALAWAYWQKGRLVALKAPQDGSFALWPLVFRGNTVRLNVCTAMTGYVQVEALDEKGVMLPGRAFTDCDFISGDHLDREVTWHGEAQLGHKAGTAVQLRFRLRNADLFSVAFH